MLQMGKKTAMTNNPFDLRDPRAYGIWRDQKLANCPSTLDELMVEIQNPQELSDDEMLAVRKACARANLAVYNFVTRDKVYQDPGVRLAKSGLADFASRFGLIHLDNNLYADDEGISSIQVSEERRQGEYIPYSNKGISWHTDGYYNPLERKIQAMVLHCVRPASQGGENALMDFELLYLLLRDENPQYIEALMQPDVMTIPANIENGVEIRPEQTGPVFSVNELTGHLHMRYTARTRSIEWKKDDVTRSAVKRLEEILAGDSPYIFRHRLSAGQGIICNNVLHTRTAFEDSQDSPGRLVYRARYYDRIK
ncbi:TauD/TfdA family dioxygenase [Kaarinaea lacus]